MKFDHAFVNCLNPITNFFSQSSDFFFFNASAVSGVDLLKINSYGNLLKSSRKGK